jgi:thiol-disulfide isomerase/thioredoxin
MKKISLLVLFFALTLSFSAFKSEKLSDDVLFVNSKDAKGKEKTFDEVVKEFKGKVVYVDFWASWCPPCRGEMPHSKALHEQFKDNKNVVFLYITFDRTEEAWKNGIDKMAIKGYHWYPSEKQRQDIVQKFGVSGIPRYMLIDKKGSIVNQDANRPSSGKIPDNINALL